MGILHKNIHLMLKLLKDLFLAYSISTPSLLHINDFSDDVICSIAIYADYTTIYSSVVRHLWQLLELASQLESDLQDTVDWGGKWLGDFNARKTQLV